MLAPVIRRSKAKSRTTKPKIAIVGAGNLGSALVQSLHAAGYRIPEIVSRGSSSRTRQLAARIGSRVTSFEHPEITADLVWFCVPDHVVASSAQALAETVTWQRRTALHSSGALSSSVLQPLAQRGARTGSVHPFMTFVPDVTPSLAGVSFAVEGERRAISLAKRIVTDLGGRTFPITEKDKALYHAWGVFASPLLTALLALTEEVARAVGVSRREARFYTAPIAQQTVQNYARRGPAAGFSGPLIRGDVATVRRHLDALRRIPGAKEVYRALARSALRNLPAKNRKALKQVLERSS